MIVAIIAFIILLVVLVVVHEFGHFIAARKLGVKIHEFAVGMGPKIWSFGKDKKGTEFTVRALPLGGFVRIKGESPQDPGAFTAKDSFLQATFWRKVIILLGGIAMNIIAAWFIFTIGFWHGVQPIQVIPDNFFPGTSESLLMPSIEYLQEQGFVSGSEVSGQALVIDVLTGQLASSIGIMSGDVILSVDGQPINNHNLSATLKKKIGKRISLTYRRGNTQSAANIQCPSSSCILGILMEDDNTQEILPIKYPLRKAMGKAVYEIRAEAKLTYPALGGIVTNLTSSNSADRKQALNNLSGPVGAARVGQYIIASGGRIEFLMFGSMISLALAFFNLLPIPALDGGRLLGVIIQKVFKIPAKKYFAVEGYINLFFFGILMLLGVYIILLDLVRAWGLHIRGIG